MFLFAQSKLGISYSSEGMELEMLLNFGQLLNWFSQLYPLIH